MLKNTKLIGLFSLTACLLSAGIVVPALSQSQEYPTQTAGDGPRTWELKSCASKPNNVVSCNFSLISSEDGKMYLNNYNDTKIVDPEGNEYKESKIQVGKRTTGEGGSIVFDIVKSANYAINIDFGEVPTSVSQITLLQIGQLGAPLVKFRNVPIINPDGSFTVIPNPPNRNRSPVESQTPNNPNQRRRVCLPIVGCF